MATITVGAISADGLAFCLIDYDNVAQQVSNMRVQNLSAIPVIVQIANRTKALDVLSLRTLAPGTAQHSILVSNSSVLVGDDWGVYMTYDG